MGAPSVILALGAEKAVSRTIERRDEAENSRRSAIITTEFDKEKDNLLQAQKKKEEEVRAEGKNLLASTRSRFSSSGFSTDSSSFEAFVKELQSQERENLNTLHATTFEELSKLEVQKNKKIFSSRKVSRNFLKNLAKQTTDPYRRLLNVFSGNFRG